MLAIQIERRFTKPQIFTLYANQIFLGHGVYGFEAASEFYFNKPAKKLTLEEAALLAGLPKGPAVYSPINHPDRAQKRRNLVINAMLEDGKITAAQAADARSAPVVLHLAHDPNSLAPNFVEEIRRYLESKYGTDQVHEGGLKVYTSLDVDLQRAANQAVLDGLAAYERRHGWKGHLENVAGENAALDKYVHPDWDDEPEANGYVHALVTFVGTGIATLKFGRYTAALGQADVAWTQHKLADILKTGDICYVKILSLGANGAAHVSLEQDSGAARIVACHRQCHRRHQGHGGWTRFQRIEIRPRHPGHAPGRLFVQALCLHDGHRRRRQPRRHNSRRAYQLRELHPVLTRRTTTTKNLKASSLCAARWLSRAIFRH